MKVNVITDAGNGSKKCLGDEGNTSCCIIRDSCYIIGDDHIRGLILFKRSLNYTKSHLTFVKHRNTPKVTRITKCSPEHSFEMTQ